MTNNKGFTLVELLAVIVILAVILVIAIPNVMKVIDKAKLDVYKRNEDMLISAAQKYMAQQGLTLNAVGDTTTISYNTDLKGNNLINNINDQKSNVECSNSKVTVTKTTTGYTYTPSLVCDNYISLDKLNLITNGDFSSGIIGWGTDSSSTISASNNILSVTGNGNNGGPYAYRQFIKTPIVGRKYYLRCMARVNNNLATSIKIMSTDTVKIINTPQQDNWYFLGGIVTKTTTYQFLVVYHVYSSPAIATGKIMEIKDCLAIDLTDIYGASNEPSDVTVIEKAISGSKQ
jgi:type IV pilus assembly protein PilA